MNSTHTDQSTNIPSIFLTPLISWWFSYTVDVYLYTLFSLSFYPSFSLRPWAITHPDSREEQKTEKGVCVSVCVCKVCGGGTGKETWRTEWWVQRKVWVSVNVCHRFQKSAAFKWKHLITSDQRHSVKRGRVSVICVSTHVCSVKRGDGRVCLARRWVTAVWHNIV